MCWVWVQVVDCQVEVFSDDVVVEESGAFLTCEGFVVEGDQCLFEKFSSL